MAGKQLYLRGSAFKGSAAPAPAWRVGVLQATEEPNMHLAAFRDVLKGVYQLAYFFITSTGIAWGHFKEFHHCIGTFRARCPFLGFLGMCCGYY